MEVKVTEDNDLTVSDCFRDWCDMLNKSDEDNQDRLSASEVADHLFEESIISEEKRDDIKNKFAGCVITNIELISKVTNIVPEKYTGTLRKYMQQMADKLADRGIEIEWTEAGPVDKKTSMDLSTNFLYPNEVNVSDILGEVKQPTEEGKVRYPPDGYYSANEIPGTPCICKSSCSANCKGECSCEACHESYVDFGH